MSEQGRYAPKIKRAALHYGCRAALLPQPSRQVWRWDQRISNMGVKGGVSWVGTYLAIEWCYLVGSMTLHCPFKKNLHDYFAKKMENGELRNIRMYKGRLSSSCDPSFVSLSLTHIPVLLWGERLHWISEQLLVIVWYNVASTSTVTRRLIQSPLRVKRRWTVSSVY